MFLSFMGRVTNLYVPDVGGVQEPRLLEQWTRPLRGAAVSFNLTPDKTSLIPESEE